MTRRQFSREFKTGAVRLVGGLLALKSPLVEHDVKDSPEHTRKQSLRF